MQVAHADYRTSQFQPCAITAGQLRSLCAEHVAGETAELAAAKVRSVREFADAHEVTCSRLDIEALGGVVTLDGQFTTEPHALPAGELRKLCNDAPLAHAAVLLKRLSGIDHAAPVTIAKSLHGELQQSIARRNARAERRRT